MNERKIKSFLGQSWVDMVAFSRYLRVIMLVRDFQYLHCSDHTLHGHENVLKDQLDEAASVIFRISRTVDDAHLFDEGRLARLAGT